MPCRYRYDALDVFKLDKIARRLNDLRSCVHNAERVQGQFDLGRIHHPGDRQVVGGVFTKVSRELQTCKKEIADVINDCLTGTLKFHIGAPSDGDGRLAGPDYEAVMSAGGTWDLTRPVGRHACVYDRQSPTDLLWLMCTSPMQVPLSMQPPPCENDEEGEIQPQDAVQYSMAC